MQAVSSQRQNLAVLGLIGVTAIWGSTFILVKWTVAEVGVYHFLFLRFLLASLLLALLFFRRLLTIRLQTLRAAFILSILMFLTYAAQTEGLRFTTASNSALITGLYMVLIPFFSLIHPRTKPDRFSLIGIALALPGLILLTQYSLTGINHGDLITLICAVSCAWHIILTGTYAKEHSIIQLVVLQFLFVTLLCGCTLLLKGGFTFELPSIAWLTLGITAVFATAFAFLVQTAAQRIVSPTRTGIIFALEAVFGALFGWWLGGEILTPIACLGACLMIGGMIISEIHPLTKYLIDKVVG